MLDGFHTVLLLQAHIYKHYIQYLTTVANVYCCLYVTTASKFFITATASHCDTFWTENSV